MGTYSYDWFSHNIGNWTSWLAPFKDQPVAGVEIGCYEGKATTWLLENILTHPDSNIWCLDTFEGGDEHKEFGVDLSGTELLFMQNTTPWRPQVFVSKGFSWVTLRNLRGMFDFCYVDGSHRAPDVLSDGVLVWPLINKGGVVIFDDYMWDHYPDPTMNPRLGIDAFLSVYAGQYELLGKEYQVAVRKL